MPIAELVIDYFGHKVLFSVVFFISCVFHRGIALYCIALLRVGLNYILQFVIALYFLHCLFIFPLNCLQLTVVYFVVKKYSYFAY